MSTVPELKHGEALRMLMTHAVYSVNVPMRPPLMVVKHPEWGTYGIALMIDGWYSDDADIDEVVEGWRTLLIRAREDAAVEVLAGR
jgi:hypothetical protein